MVHARDKMHNPDVADFSSYGINSFIMTAGGGVLADVDRYRPSRPPNTILLADLGPDYGDSTPANDQSRPKGPSRNSSLLAWDDGFDIFEGAAEPWLTARHGDGINILTLSNTVTYARTFDRLQKPIYSYYDECAAGGCTLCNELNLYHYSFARSRLYWWTGPAPEPVITVLGN
jgi:hypothetical protein